MLKEHEILHFISLFQRLISSEFRTKIRKCGFDSLNALHGVILSGAQTCGVFALRTALASQAHLAEAAGRDLLYRSAMILCNLEKQKFCVRVHSERCLSNNREISFNPSQSLFMPLYSVERYAV